MLNTLAKETKGVRLVSILTPVCMIGEVIMEMILPRLMSTIIDDGVTAGNLSVIYRVGGWMIVAAAVGLFFGVMGGVLGARASTGYARNLRRSMFKNIQTFSFANIDKFSTAGLVTRMTTDVTNLQNAYQMILRMAIRAPASMIIAMCMAFSIHAGLARIYLVAVIFLGICLVIIMTRASRYFSNAFKKYDDLNESVQENVSAIRVVKAYVREDFESEKFKKASGNVQQLLLKAEKVLSYNAPLMMATVYTCILLISWLGARMIVLSGATEFTTGELMSMLTYCMNILTSLMMLSMVFVMITMSAASARRISEVLTEQSTLANCDKPLTEVKNGAVRFDHVCFRYKDDGRDVLSDISLNIRSGETVGIIGAMVLQKNELFSGTIADNLRWGNKNATQQELEDACKQACADEFIERFPDKYETHIDQGGANVSGGQKQRLCIARALLKKPKILILDDSTSAVDTATDAKIRRSFAEKIPGTTVFIIAQRISSVENADKVLVLDGGRVSGFGTPAEMLATNPIYQEVYNSQTQGSGDFDEKGGEA